MSTNEKFALSPASVEKLRIGRDRKLALLDKTIEDLHNGVMASEDAMFDNAASVVITSSNGTVVTIGDGVISFMELVVLLQNTFRNHQEQIAEAWKSVPRWVDSQQDEVA